MSTICAYVCVLQITSVCVSDVVYMTHTCVFTAHIYIAHVYKQTHRHRRRRRRRRRHGSDTHTYLPSPSTCPQHNPGRWWYPNLLNTCLLFMASYIRDMTQLRLYNKRHDC